MGQIIAFAGKGGAGKSICASNIAYALSGLEKRVLVIDCDFGMRTQDIIFGVQNSVVYNLVDILTDKCSVDDGIISVTEGVDLICATQNTYIDELDFDLFYKHMDSLKNKYDFIFIDCPAGVNNLLKNLLACCDGVVIISDCTFASARAGDSVAALTEKCNISKKYLIINKINIDSGVKNGIINSEEVLNIVAVAPIGAVPYDKELGFGITEKKKSHSAKAFKNIALRLCGEKVPVLYVKKKGIF